MSISKRKRGCWCSAPNCSNNSNINKDLSFFSFPKDDQRAIKWAINSGREDLLKKDTIYLSKSCTICTVHFEDSMFLNFPRSRLKGDAVPTLFDVSNPPKKLSQKEKKPKKISQMYKKIICKAKSDDIDEEKYEHDTTGHDVATLSGVVTDETEESHPSMQKESWRFYKRKSLGTNRLDSKALKGQNFSQNIDYIKEDGCDITAKQIAVDLRQMDKFQRMIAEVIISDVMNYGKAGKLKMNHEFKSTVSSLPMLPEVLQSKTEISKPQQMSTRGAPHGSSPQLFLDLSSFLFQNNK